MATKTLLYGRPAAVRALILYPMNALVEDQLARLRAALDGDPARQWLSARRAGNRFYFGRYTSRTPVAGPQDPGKRKRLRDALVDMEQEALQVAGSQAAHFFPRLDGGEIWSRWDVQETPPDILITNYSMLNIMLMRSLEAPVFDLTRQWLETDRSHVFHLIVDELHTYRGTPGTEVAYLIRVLLERLGLQPDSPQLRIIASSASVAGDASGLDYLEAFFGRDRNRFRIVTGSMVTPKPGAAARVRNHATALRDLGQQLRGASGNIQVAASTFHQAVGAPSPPDNDLARVLGAALEHIDAPSALREVCAAPGTQIARPRTPRGIGTDLFPDLPDNERAPMRRRVCLPGSAQAAMQRAVQYCPSGHTCSSVTFKACGFAPIPDAMQRRSARHLVLSAVSITRRRLLALVVRGYWSFSTAKPVVRCSLAATAGQAITRMSGI